MYPLDTVMTNVCSIFCASSSMSYLIFRATLRLTIFQVRRLMLRELKWFFQGYLANA